MISPYILGHPTNTGRHLILVDTPGFNSAVWNDYTIIQRLAKWLKQSLPPRSCRKLAIVYFLDIGRHICEGNASRAQLQTWCRRIAENFVIATTKSGLSCEDVGQRQKESISSLYNRNVPAFQGTQASARVIIDTIPNKLLEVSDFVFELAGTRHVAELSVNKSVTRSLSLPGFGVRTSKGDNIAAYGGLPRTKPPHPVNALPSLREERSGDMKELSRVDLITRLEEISTRLTTAFNDTHEYKRLLSCRGLEAQALLDTFQSIIGLASFEDHLRRDLITATKRLSSNADLYPSSFALTDVWRTDIRPMASGTYADIYRGRYQGQPVCLKIVRVYERSSYEYIAKVIAREAILWGQLSHPNLLPFHGLYWFDRQLSLVYPWAENGNIVDFLKKQPTANRVFLCSDVAKGIKYLHDNEIIHGDLKSENVLVDKSSRAYLADFGLSSVKDPEILLWASQSAAASTGGTLRYQAPELFELENDGGAEGSLMPTNTMPTDVYAWACLCYQVFTGKLPFFEYRSEAAVMMKVMQGTRPTRPAALEGQDTTRSITEDIWGLMNDCWERDPASRPTIIQALSRVDVVNAMDDRPSAEWKIGASMQEDGFNDSDLPLTLETLNVILSKDPSQ